MTSLGPSHGKAFCWQQIVMSTESRQRRKPEKGSVSSRQCPGEALAPSRRWGALALCKLSGSGVGLAGSRTGSCWKEHRGAGCLGGDVIPQSHTWV